MFHDLQEKGLFTFYKEQEELQKIASKYQLREFNYPENTVKLKQCEEAFKSNETRMAQKKRKEPHQITFPFKEIKLNKPQEQQFKARGFLKSIFQVSAHHMKNHSHNFDSFSYELESLKEEEQKQHMIKVIKSMRTSQVKEDKKNQKASFKFKQLSTTQKQNKKPSKNMIRQFAEKSQINQNVCNVLMLSLENNLQKAKITSKSSTNKRKLGEQMLKNIKEIKQYQASQQIRVSTDNLKINIEKLTQKNNLKVNEIQFSSREKFPNKYTCHRSKKKSSTKFDYLLEKLLLDENQMKEINCYQKYSSVINLSSKRQDDTSLRWNRKRNQFLQLLEKRKQRQQREEKSQIY